MIQERFSSHYQKVLQTAYTIAFEQKYPTITLGHVVLALMMENGSIGAELLRKVKVTPETLIEYLNQEESKKNSTKSAIKNNPRKQKINFITFDDNVMQTIERSIVLAYSLKHPYVGTEHLVASLLKHPDINEIIRNQGTRESLKTSIDLILKNTTKFTDLTAEFNKPDTEQTLNELSEFEETRQQSTSTSSFIVDLTDPNAQKNIDPVIGREGEIKRIINILGRRSKNNPILLGEPGVGKTAIIEGLAKKIFNKDVPDFLINKKIYSLDLASLVAGTMYRGEFEGRLKQLIEELKQNSEIILFIDEVHNLIGTGATSGSMDAANILKPALARGNLRCIGATTFDEYKKHIEKDPALDRRFQSVIIHEATAEQAEQVILGLRTYYEKFHQINIPKNMIREVVDLSIKYIHGYQLPDKAIDLLDEACALCNVHTKKTSHRRTIKTVSDKVLSLQKSKHEAILSENFNQAIKLQKIEKNLLDRLEQNKKQLEQSKNKKIGTLTIKHLHEIVAIKTKIPIKNFSTDHLKNLQTLKKRLKSMIIGQDSVCDTIVSHLQKAYVLPKNQKRTMAAFLFTGPSGVGKTYTAKTLAELLYKDPNRLIRIDMSEFSDSMSISKLIGSPAGYVGYRENTQLSDRIRHNPYSIILFDEIDKAHHSIRNMILQILDEGRLTDATGKVIDFTHSIIIGTSNLGNDVFEGGKIGFSKDETQDEQQNSHIIDFATKLLNKELVDRFDKVIIFNRLDENNLNRITKKQIDEMIKNLSSHDIKISLSQNVIAHIARAGQKHGSGARMINKTIERLIEYPLSEHVIKSIQKRRRGAISIKIKDENIIIA